MASEEIRAPWQREAAERLTLNEASALQMLLENEFTKVMVVVIAADSDAEGSTRVMHVVSDGTRRSHAVQFIKALNLRATRITEALEKRS